MKIFFNIKKLGAITNSKIEFKPLMIFSGDSSLGKSYTAFVVYYFIHLFTDGRMKTFLESNHKNESFKKDGGFLFNMQDFKRWMGYDLNIYIGYLVGLESFDSDIEIDFDMADIKISYEFLYGSSEIKDDLSKDDSLVQIKINENVYNSLGTIFNNDPIRILEIALSKYFKEKLFNKSDSSFQTLFLPPSRAAFAGTNFSTSQQLSSNLGMYKEYLKDMEALNSISDEKFHPSKNIINLLKDLLCGEIINEKGVLYYKFEDNRIPLTSAASSIKELAPLFLLLKKFKPNEFSVLFEEPEAHTHPKMQVKMANVISHLVNKGSFFQITTHSDYFLNQINNLLKLNKVKEKDKNRFKELCVSLGIGTNSVLKPKEIGAYYFHKREDGSVEIITQDVTNGVPFQTFENTVDNLLNSSELIEEELD